MHEWTTRIIVAARSPLTALGTWLILPRRQGVWNFLIAVITRETRKNVIPKLTIRHLIASIGFRAEVAERPEEDSYFRHLSNHQIKNRRTALLVTPPYSGGRVANHIAGQDTGHVTAQNTSIPTSSSGLVLPRPISWK